MRPYISVGGGGPRLGVVLGRREVAGVAKLFIGLGVFLFVCWLMATYSKFDDANQAWLVLIMIPIMFWICRRPYSRPMTKADLEAEFQAGKREWWAR